MASSAPPTRRADPADDAEAADPLPATEVWADALRRGLLGGRRRPSSPTTRRPRRSTTVTARGPSASGCHPPSGPADDWSQQLTARLALDRRDLDREASAMRLNARPRAGRARRACRGGPRAGRCRSPAVGPGQRTPGGGGPARADRLQPAPGGGHPHRVRPPPRRHPRPARRRGRDPRRHPRGGGRRRAGPHRRHPVPGRARVAGVAGPVAGRRGAVPRRLPAAVRVGSASGGLARPRRPRQRAHRGQLVWGGRWPSPSSTWPSPWWRSGRPTASRPTAPSGPPSR